MGWDTDSGVWGEVTAILCPISTGRSLQSNGTGPNQLVRIMIALAHWRAQKFLPWYGFPAKFASLWTIMYNLDIHYNLLNSLICIQAYENHPTAILIGTWHITLHSSTKQRVFYYVQNLGSHVSIDFCFWSVWPPCPALRKIQSLP